ncbi:TPA: Arc family DNA-binding protein [Yersinia enterocolitica]|nr:Arc family DNA-binding protein [Yersinia enterocolitica]
MARDEPKVNIRLPQELKDKLHELAERNKRSVNAEMISAIELALDHHEAGRFGEPDQSLAIEIKKQLDRIEGDVKRLIEK